MGGGYDKKTTPALLPMADPASFHPHWGVGEGLISPNHAGKLPCFSTCAYTNSHPLYSTSRRYAGAYVFFR